MLQVSLHPAKVAWVTLKDSGDDSKITSQFCWYEPLSQTTPELHALETGKNKIPSNETRREVTRSLLEVLYLQDLCPFRDNGNHRPISHTH